MDILRRFFRMTKPKPYKIQDAERKIGRVGVAASTLKDLKEKAAAKFGIEPTSKLRIVLEEDGTEIEDEDYFATLPGQTAFVVLKQGQFWNGYITYLELATKKILENISTGRETIDYIMTMLKDPDCPEFMMMMNYIKDQSLNIEAETIEDDPDWFVGIPGKQKTKEAVMRKSAKERVRAYWNNSKDFINSSEISSKTRKALLLMLDVFRAELKETKYFEEYFARSGSKKMRMCDDKGWFTCEGTFDEKKCSGLHQINPYGSKDGRVLFKTWNLDHRIEKSREILPKMVQATEECPENKEVDWEYFYDLLFTRKNLKLVDIRCHVVTKHNSCEVDRRRIYRKRKWK